MTGVQRKTTRSVMKRVLDGCRDDNWGLVFNLVQGDPNIATNVMITENHLSTTVLHQAITSQANVQVRVRLIQMVLNLSPKAATIRSGNGSLPLHAILQQNVKIDVHSKEEVIKALVELYPDALLMEGGISRRTPLHAALAQSISSGVVYTMIHQGTKAAYMKDREGRLPIHVAVSYHCTPEILFMLLEVNPNSLYTRIGSSRETLLALAKNKCTKEQPNVQLIAALERQLSLPRGLYNEEEKSELDFVDRPTKGIANRVPYGERKRKRETDTSTPNS